MVLLFCWVGMVGIKSGNACGKDKDENAVVLPVYERNGRMYVEIEQTYLGREWMVLAQIDRGLGIGTRQGFYDPGCFCGFLSGESFRYNMDE